MPPINNTNLVRKMIYFAFLLAPFIHSFIVYQQLLRKGEPIAFNAYEVLEIPFIFYYLGSVAFIVYIFKYLGEIIKNTNDNQVFVLELIRYALAESFAVFGLVAFFSFKSLSQFVVFVVVTIILMLFAYPKNKAL